MKKPKIAIVGAGLSGLYAAYKLQKMGGTDYVLLESRDVPGGRILTLSARQMGAPGSAASGVVDYFDLGPSWFWPDFQPELSELIEELGLQRYPQHEAGDMLIERERGRPVVRTSGYISSSTAMRIHGGMGTLIAALQDQLDSARIHTGQTVRYIRQTEQGLEVESHDASYQATIWNVDHVLLAIPPRLVQATIAFSPALPLALSQSWKQTATWMAPHAKYVAIYATPFWRKQGLSGEARSGLGPLVEIHDASTAHGQAALFGFVGVPAPVRNTLGQSEIRALCRAQLSRLFGSKAGSPTADFLKDWAADPHTAIEADRASTGQHASAPPSQAALGPWKGCLTGVASEWSMRFPGYLAGAIDAVDRALLAWIAAIPRQ